MSETWARNNFAQPTIRDAPLNLWREVPNWRELAEQLGAKKKNDRALAAMAVALAQEAITRGRQISYSRSHDHYSSYPAAYHNGLYTYRRVVSAVDLLDERGLIEHCKVSPGHRGQQSFMSACHELVQIVLPFLAAKVTIHRPRRTIWLRDETGQLVDYKRSGLRDAMQRDLDEQNEVTLSIDFGPYSPSKTFQVRIFNGDFKHGGRFYAIGGGWQNLPRDQRRDLTINGEATIELDYCQLHPVLAYWEAGHAPPADAYEIDDFPRDLAKIAFGVMLNSDNQSAARQSLAWKPLMLEHVYGGPFPLRGDAKSIRLRINQILATDPDLILRAHRAARSLLDAMERKHAPIHRFFYSGAGLHFQNIDSQLTMAVMRHMRKIGEPTLSIHDSFIVRASQEDRLHQVMMVAAEEMGAKILCRRS